MALSPNYGWSEPDNTDLVKNGAQAMRTLGDAIDTSVWNVGFGQAGKNKTSNAAMQIWQRGTSFAVTTPVYAADRWQVARAANVAGSTVSRQLTSDTTNLPNIQYCMRISRDSGNTSTNTLYLAQAMETVNSIPLAGRTVTVSFYARKGANYSATSSVINVKLQSGTGTDQNNLTGAYTGSANVTNQNAVLTTTWQRFSSTGTIAATATELAYLIEANPTGTAGAADYYEITGIQLEVGSIATPFQTASGGSIQGELAMCQRYYYQTDSLTDNTFSPAIAATTGVLGAYFTYPVSMRVAPTITTYDTAGASGVVTRGTYGSGTIQNGQASTVFQTNRNGTNIYSGSGNSHTFIRFGYSAAAEL